MTPEEAIKILDPETSRGTLWKYEDKEERLEAVNEACRLAVAALRAQQKLNVPLTLEELRGADLAEGFERTLRMFLEEGLCEFYVDAEDRWEFF